MGALLPDSSHRASALGGEDFRGARPHVLQLSVCCVSATPQGASVSLAGKLAKPGVALEVAPPPVHVAPALEQVARICRIVLLQEVDRCILLAVEHPGKRLDTNEFCVERRIAARTRPVQHLASTVLETRS